MRFGVELEYSLLTSDEAPQLGSAAHVIARARHFNIPAVSELASFQIELNPGPWPLDSRGISVGLSEAALLERQLAEIAEADGLRLSPCALTPTLDTDTVRSPHFFAAEERYSGTSRYFAERTALVRFEDGSTFVLPGETAVGCINEIHVNVQMDSDVQTMTLFNALNLAGYPLANRYQERLVLNGKPLAPSCTTMSLFEEANGEIEESGVSRVGFLPRRIHSWAEYQAYVAKFRCIPVPSGKALSLDGTVYFWVRLRGTPGALRVEYRPIDMAPDWARKVESFLCRSLALVAC